MTSNIPIHTFFPVEFPEQPGVYIGISVGSWGIDEEWNPTLTVRLIDKGDDETLWVPDIDIDELEGLTWYQVEQDE
jgi:hypothetical protein